MENNLNPTANMNTNANAKDESVLDHVQVHVKDLRPSLTFYRAILDALELGHTLRVDKNYFSANEFMVDANPQAKACPIHVAFSAPSEEAVRRFHLAGLEAGGKDNGPPGIRQLHDPNYYAAYLHDPDGNNVEAVFHRPPRNSNGHPPPRADD
ncbi:VOC family protein [Usitatibacter palustris]|uniref:VOC family protein n=1 Tax=Usitatibacter palustris TaxID=2732487 RepID=UPI001BB25D57|nr:VOC family protein [Usitatibacter palustris]